MRCIFQIAVLLICTNYCLLVADAFSYSPHHHKKLVLNQFHSSANHKRALLPRYSSSCLFSSQDDTSNNNNESSNSDKTSSSSSSSSETSKRQMLKFAIPALGIYLTNPLLSNIDNAFVGRTVGAMGLAALSPATLCIDQALYLFSFLSRATTGLASRAYSSSQQSTNDINSEEETEEAAKTRMKEAASPAFSISIFCGVIMSLLYLTCVPQILQALNVDPLLHTSATSYIHWRGAISWAAMSQAVLLSLFMVMKDAVTPLKIIASAAIFNVLGDGLFCVWPLR